MHHTLSLRTLELQEKEHENESNIRTVPLRTLELQEKEHESDTNNRIG